MEIIQAYNLNNLCRLCLSKADNMTRLFDSPSDLDFFKRIVNIELQQNEAYPERICNACKDKILTFQEFVYQCQKSEELLQKYRRTETKREDKIPNNININLEYNKSIRIQERNLRDTIDSDYFDGDDNFDVTRENDDFKNIDSKEKISHEEVVQAIDRIKQELNQVRNCIKCSFESTNFMSLSVHMSYAHKDLSERWCTVCNAIFDDLKSHIGVHTEINTCQFCGKFFSRRTYLLDHLMRHTYYNPYKCNFYDKTYNSKKYLEIRNSNHTKEKCFKCNLCLQTFKKLHSLESHKCEENKEIQQANKIISLKCNRVKQNYCVLCQKNVKSLKIHIQRIHENKPFSCTLRLCTMCGKQFPNYAKLTIHMRTHTGETPYSCSYCDKKLSTRNNLTVHERTHTGVKPYVCHVCGKAFSQSSIRNTHLKLHFDKSEKCLICAKEFYRSTDLKLHMKNHTGEKPFPCSYCDKGFTRNSHLKQHLRQHSGEQPFKCDQCDKSFRRNFSLKKHKRIHLRGQDEEMDKETTAKDDAVE